MITELIRGETFCKVVCFTAAGLNMDTKLNAVRQINQRQNFVKDAQSTTCQFEFS